MLKELQNLIDKIDLNWCDNPGKDLQNTDTYQTLLSIFPNLQPLHQKWVKSDPFEFNRTMRHVFRCFKIFFLLKAHNLNYKTLSEVNLQKLTKKIEKFTNLNELYFPIIIMYHDIGRYIDRKTHTFQSSELIRKEALLEDFDFSPIEKLFVRKLIEYHLLLATIYTGESTFFGILSLLNDPEFIELISHQDKRYTDLFFELLEIFTYIDVLGYPYSQIFDHYLTYYEDISVKLKEISNLWPDNDKILSLAKKYSIDWNDWRLAGALRIFQFVDTKQHLTKNFYYSVLQASIRPICEKRGKFLNWNSLKDTYLSNIYKLQVRYALPLLMLLAFKEFKRATLKEDQEVSSDLLLFWILLSAEVTKRGLREKEAVINVYFENLPFWSEITKDFIQNLQITRLKTIIKSGSLEFDQNKREYTFLLNFKQL
ncbi:MAG TPA: hypothetical protein VMV49_17400 [Candidatus Deferrimicrobium sp.]|nr:hypothetical protein [Candidatus Deferrimicrobium sp.]